MFFTLLFELLFAGLAVKNQQTMLETYIERVDRNGKPQYRCNICGKEFGQKPHVQNHVENIHFPDSFEYQCKYCGTSFNTRNKYYKHLSMFHKYDR